MASIATGWQWAECPVCSQLFKQKIESGMPLACNRSCSRILDWKQRDADRFKRNDLIRQFLDQPEVGENREAIKRAFWRVFNFK